MEVWYPSHSVANLEGLNFALQGARDVARHSSENAAALACTHKNSVIALSHMCDQIDALVGLLGGNRPPATGVLRKH